MGDYRKSIDYHAKHLKIALEISDRGGEGGACGGLGIAYTSLSDYQKSSMYHEKHLKIELEISDRAGGELLIATMEVDTFVFVLRHGG